MKLRDKRENELITLNILLTFNRIIHKILKKEEQYVEDLDLIEKVVTFGDVRSKLIYNAGLSTSLTKC